MSEAYTVFVHLLDGRGTVLGQNDGPPLNGDYPTLGWSPGEELADRHTIPIKDSTTAGTRLSVGLYRLQDGTRLPVYAPTGERVPGDAIPINLDARAAASDKR
jgi:hypothetical protein